MAEIDHEALQAEVDNLRAEVESLRHEIKVVRGYLSDRDEIIELWVDRDKRNRKAFAKWATRARHERGTD